MKMLVMNREITLSIFMMMVLICGWSGISYGQDAITISNAECKTSNVIPGVGAGFADLTVKGTMRANRTVRDIRGWLTINGNRVRGANLLGDLSAGQTKSFSITEVFVRVSDGDRCGVSFEWKEVNPPPDDQQPDPPKKPDESESLTTTIVRLQPSSVASPAVGEQLTVSLNIEGGKAVAGYQATVQFDATALRYVSSANGDYLPPGALFVKPIVDRNVVRLAAVSRTGEISGDGTLATLTFEVVAVKTSALVLSDILISNSAAEGSIPQIEDAQITEPTGLKKEPDMVVTSIRASDTTVSPGESFTLSTTVKNSGSGQSNRTTLRYYRSSNDRISSSDTEVGTDSVSVLEANRTSPESISLMAPMTPGTYYYGACVDSVTNESDTNNNCSAAVTVTVVVASPDLVVEAVQAVPATVEPGETFRLYATLKNQGTGESAATTLRYYRSSNATISTQDTRLRSANRDPLAANATIRRYLTVTAPTTPGTYYYGACVDSVSSESDTANNCSRAVSVTVTAPPMVAEDVNVDGVVDVQDLVYIAQRYGQTSTTTADVNGDGVVNIDDLILVAAVLDADAAAAPSLYSGFLETFTAAEVKLWLSQARQRDFKDPSVRRGIQFLEQLLASMVPKETALLANYPNPFNPETWIPYQLAKDADVTLTIYAVNGHVVRRLSLGHQPAGIYQNRNRAVYWDGKNAFGESVASGVYFYTFTAGDFTATRKMLIRK